MPELAGRVADTFEALVREHEDSWLSPLAVRSYETQGRERDARTVPTGRARDPESVQGLTAVDGVAR